MYLRTVKAKGADGVEVEYIRLVEAYWENGRSKQRVVASLGRFGAKNKPCAKKHRTPFGRSSVGAGS